MWRLAWRGARAHWLRLLLTILAIVLGIGFLVGSFVVTDTIRAAFDDLFRQTTAGTSAVARYQPIVKDSFDDERPPVPRALLDRVAKVPGVGHVEGTIQVRNVRMLDRRGNEIAGLAPQFGEVWPADLGLSPWRLAAGRPPATKDEVVIDRGTANGSRFGVGDRIKIITQLPQQYYRIVGIATFGRVDRPLGATVALFTPAQAQAIAGYHDEYDVAVVGAQPGVPQETVAARIRTALGVEAHPEAKAGTPTLEVLTGNQYREEQISEIRKNLNFFYIVLGVFAAIGLLAGAFIIFNTFTIIVSQRTRELALLRAVGAQPRQVFVSTLGEALIVGIVGAAAGVATGIGLAATLRAIISSQGGGLPGGAAVIEQRTVLIGLIVGTFVTLAAAVIPAWKAARTKPIEALRSAAIEGRIALTGRIVGGIVTLVVGALFLLDGLFVVTGGRRIWLIGVGGVVMFGAVIVAGPPLVRGAARIIGAPLPAISGMAGRLARENAARSPRRSARTAVTLTMGIAIITLIMVLGESVRASFAQIFGSQINADYIVSGGGGLRGGFKIPPDVLDRFRRLPSVDAATGIRFDGVVVHNSKKSKKPLLTGAAAIDAEIAPRVISTGQIDGDLLGLRTGVAISKEFSKSTGLRRGDRISMSMLQESAPFSLPINAVFATEVLRSPIVVSTPTFAKHSRPATKTSFDLILVRPGVTRARLDADARAIRADYPILSLQTPNEFIGNTVKQFDPILNFIYLLLALSVVIALLGVVNTLLLSIYERTREIGLLRAVGMSRRQVRTSIGWEAIIIAIFGIAAGLAVGLFFAWAVIKSLSDQGFKEFAIPTGQIVFLAIAGVIAASLSGIFPAWRAGRLNVLEAIATE